MSSLETEKKKLQQANQIWNYFSGLSFDLSVLSDYRLMNKAIYYDFCSDLQDAKEKKVLPLRLNRDDLFKAFTVGLTPRASMDYSLLYDNTFEVLYYMTGPLRFKRWELGLRFDTQNPKLDKESFNRFKQAFLSRDFKENSDVRQDICFSFVTNVIFDLERVVRNSDRNGSYVFTQKERNAAYSKAHYLDENLRLVLTGLSDYKMQKELPRLMSAIQKEKSPYLSELFSFCSKVFCAFDLNQTSMNAAREYEKEAQLLELVDRAIIYHPSDLTREKAQFFDEMPSVKKVVSRYYQDSIYQEIKEIYKQRG